MGVTGKEKRRGREGGRDVGKNRASEEGVVERIFCDSDHRQFECAGYTDRHRYIIANTHTHTHI